MAADQQSHALQFRAGICCANCSNCHTTVGWDAASFNHATTGFALTGVHATTPCAQCHVNNNYSLTSADCYGCHTRIGTRRKPGRQRTEPCDRRISHFAVFAMPRHNDLGGLHVQSRHHRLPAHQLAPTRARRQSNELRAVPRQQQLHAEFRPRIAAIPVATSLPGSRRIIPRIPRPVRHSPWANVPHATTPFPGPT